MLKQYYKLCLRHMRRRDNCFQFWGKNNRGYFKNVESAELYSESEATTIDFKTQVNRGDFYVEKALIDSMLEDIQLPVYGDVVETYVGLNKFKVLPNTGQVRKALGIVDQDIKLEGSNDSFVAYFEDTVLEKYKWVYNKGEYRVKAKESVDEFFYYDDNFEAENRNKAILKAYKYWDFDYECSYIDFKNMVTCSRTKTLVFDRWV